MENPPEFKPNFKIPLNPAPPGTSPEMTSIINMNNWNYTSMPPTLGVMPNVWSPQTTQNFNYPSTETVVKPSPTVISAPPILNVIGIKRKIDKDMMQELNDPSLPKELTSQFQPLFCKLCMMRLNSSSNAKLHYLSKNHQKKVRKFLIEYSERTGQPVHKKAKVSSKPVPPDDPKYTYCSICDLQLTSRLHADQHYMGKNHQRAALKIKAPAGSGYYDKQGNWHRVEKSKPDPTGRHGIGLAFATPEELQKCSVQPPSKYYCDLCKVSATSTEHLQMHMNGQKHLKLLRRNGVPPSVPDPFGDLEGTNQTNFIVPTDNILMSVIQNDAIGPQDYSVFRTPTGGYYCQPCNLTISTEQQFVRHLESKKHYRKKSIYKS